MKIAKRSGIIFVEIIEVIKQLDFISRLSVVGICVSDIHYKNRS
jgi:hypothetical protein